jgi:hypothetical protein
MVCLAPAGLRQIYQHLASDGVNPAIKAVAISSKPGGRATLQTQKGGTGLLYVLKLNRQISVIY